MFELKQTCKGCGKTKPHEDDYREQWWNCSGYFKLSGLFCSSCYDKISHNSYGKLNHPREYMMMLLKHGNGIAQ